MHPTVFTTLLLFFGGALAAPKCVNKGYGTFYNDHACKTNPSAAFSLANAGCIANEYSQNSIYLQQSCEVNPKHHLVWSPGNNCNCQNDCAAVPDIQGCWDLNGHKAASSFRFINQGCAKNNC